MFLLPFMADVLLKATLILLAVTLVDRVLQRASAAVRHRMWSMAFVALLLLPVLSATVPQGGVLGTQPFFINSREYKPPVNQSELNRPAGKLLECVCPRRRIPAAYSRLLLGNHQATKTQRSI